MRNYDNDYHALNNKAPDRAPSLYMLVNFQYMHALPRNNQCMIFIATFLCSKGISVTALQFYFDHSVFSRCTEKCIRIENITFLYELTNLHKLTTIKLKD